MRVKVAVCAALLLGALISPAMATIIVRIEPASQSVDISAGTTTAQIVADIPEADAIIGWGLDLTLSGPGRPFHISLADLEIPSPPFDPAVAPDGDGLAALVPAPDEVFGNGVVLANLTFNLLAVGLTYLDVSYNDPLNEGMLIEADPGFAEVQFVQGSITVTPEPTALALLAVGGLLLRRR